MGQIWAGQVAPFKQPIWCSEFPHMGPILSKPGTTDILLPSISPYGPHMGKPICFPSSLAQKTHTWGPYEATQEQTTHCRPAFPVMVSTWESQYISHEVLPGQSPTWGRKGRPIIFPHNCTWVSYGSQWTQTIRACPYGTMWTCPRAPYGNVTWAYAFPPLTMSFATRLSTTP